MENTNKIPEKEKGSKIQICSKRRLKGVYNANK